MHDLHDNPKRKHADLQKRQNRLDAKEFKRSYKKNDCRTVSVAFASCADERIQRESKCEGGEETLVYL